MFFCFAFKFSSAFSRHYYYANDSEVAVNLENLDK